MKLFKLLAGAGITAVAGLMMMSADHIDAPAVSGQSTDIADYYAFQSPDNSDNMVFAATLQGLLSPMATGDASFDERVMIEFNIDNDGDAVEDLIIQAIPKDGKMYVFGPYAPSATGVNSMVASGQSPVSVDITSYGSNASIGSENGISVFAGPRDDPFFFDLGAYSSVLAGDTPGFADPGTDTFAGTNVLSVVVEIPKSMLGNAETINTWVESKVKQ